MWRAALVRCPLQLSNPWSLGVSRRVYFSSVLAAAAATLAVLGLPAPDAGPGRPLAMSGAYANEAPKIFHGVGVVTAVEPGSGMLSVDHGDIPGLMDAMEMAYKVRPAALCVGLQKGDTIAFGVDGRTYTIVEIKKIAKP